MSRIEIGGRSITTGEIQDLLATDHPMVERFRFERTGERYLALHIVPRAGVRHQQQRDSRGRRVPPVSRTLKGSEIVGQGNRSIWLEGEELVAENSTFFPRQEYNDLGIGSALYVSMERLYRHLGISRVTLLAVDVGVYVWARQGFAFAESGRAAGLVKDLERYVNEQGASVSLDPSRFAVSGSPATGHAVSGHAESWDLANCDLPGAVQDDMPHKSLGGPRRDPGPAERALHRLRAVCGGLQPRRPAAPARARIPSPGQHLARAPAEDAARQFGRGHQGLGAAAAGAGDSGRIRRITVKRREISL